MDCQNIQILTKTLLNPIEDSQNMHTLVQNLSNTLATITALYINMLVLLEKPSEPPMWKPPNLKLKQQKTDSR